VPFRTQHRTHAKDTGAPRKNEGRCFAAWDRETTVAERIVLALLMSPHVRKFSAWLTC
jgi:hypothetical protein